MKNQLKNQPKNQIIKTLFVVFLLINMPFIDVFAQKNYKETIESAKTKIAAKDYENAIPLLKKAIEFKPKIAENYYLSGLCHYYLEKNKEAIPFYDEAIKQDAKKWVYFKRRADALYNTNQFAKSLPDYLKAIELEPTKRNDTLFQYLADNYRLQDNFQLAADNYDKAININNNNPKTYFDRAYMHVQLKNAEKACTDYKKSFEVGEKNIDKSLEYDANKYFIAKTEAYSLLSCEWAKPKKDNSVVNTTNVEVVPFTGTIITSKGLNYDKLEISPENGGGFVTSAVFAYGDEINIKLKKPTNFNLDNNKAFVGVGFAIFDGEKAFAQQENIYKENNNFDAEMLKSLTLSVNFTKPLIFDKTYTLKTKFFDNLSNRMILLDMPFTLADSTSKANAVNNSKNTIADGANTSAAGEVEIKKISTIIDKKNKNKINGIFLSQTKNFSNNVVMRYSFVDKNTGERVSLSDFKTLTISTFVGEKGFNVPLESPKINKDYILWVEVKDKKDKNKI